MDVYLNLLDTSSESTLSAITCASWTECVVQVSQALSAIIDNRESLSSGRLTHFEIKSAIHSSSALTKVDARLSQELQYIAPCAEEFLWFIAPWNEPNYTVKSSRTTVDAQASHFTRSKYFMYVQGVLSQLHYLSVTDIVKKKYNS